MRYYRCKCGKQTGWASMPFPPCSGCKDCNTTMAEGPEFHEIPSPHEYIIRFDQYTGKPYEVCEMCWKRKEDIEQEESDPDFTFDSTSV